MEKNLEKILVGQKMEPRYLEYTWRDIILYALGIGAKADDLNYVYEKNIKAFPTYGTIPYWNAINVRPYQWMPLPASMMTNDVLDEPDYGFLNMDHEIIMHRPIDPIKGTFQWQDEIVDVYDRGEGKGVVVKTKVLVRDEAGRDICTNYSTTFFRNGGGFGGSPMPKSDVIIPDVDPDIVEDDYIEKTQNLLYRLSGDTNLIHVDPEYAKNAGVEKPIMQGFCSFGYCCRLAIKNIIKDQPERMTRMYAQMRNVLYPGTNVSIHIWKISEGKAYFRFINKETGKVVLDRGIFEWK